MKQVIILVDGNKSYVQMKFEALKEMFKGTEFLVEVVTEEITSMSGAKFERQFLKIMKEGG